MHVVITEPELPSNGHPCGLWGVVDNEIFRGMVRIAKPASHADRMMKS